MITFLSRYLPENTEVVFNDANILVLLSGRVQVFLFEILLLSSFSFLMSRLAILGCLKWREENVYHD